MKSLVFSMKNQSFLIDKADDPQPPPQVPIQEDEILKAEEDAPLAALGDGGGGEDSPLAARGDGGGGSLSDRWGTKSMIFNTKIIVFSATFII